MFYINSIIVLIEQINLNQTKQIDLYIIFEYNFCILYYGYN